VRSTNHLAPRYACVEIKEGVVYRSCDTREKNKILVGKPEKKILRHREKDNIKMHLKSIEWKTVDWLDLIQGMNKLTLNFHIRWEGIY
jgi:hypothetical protein